jgi:hypothetical protein
MLNQVGVTFSDGAPIITELITLTIIELHWNLDVGGKFTLGNLVL